MRAWRFAQQQVADVEPPAMPPLGEPHSQTFDAEGDPGGRLERVEPREHGFGHGVRWSTRRAAAFEVVCEPDRKSVV